MIADVRRWMGCGEKFWNLHISVTIRHEKVVQRIAVEVDQRGADAQKLRPRQSADFDERSTSTCRWYIRSAYAMIYIPSATPTMLAYLAASSHC